MLDVRREGAARAVGELRRPALGLGLRERLKRLHPPRLDSVTGIQYHYTETSVAKRLCHGNAGRPRAYDDRFHTRSRGHDTVVKSYSRAIDS